MHSCSTSLSVFALNIPSAPSATTPLTKPGGGVLKICLGTDVWLEILTAIQ